MAVAWYCKTCREKLGSTKQEAKDLAGCPNCGDKNAVKLDDFIPEQADNEVEKDPLKRKLQEMNKKRDEETKYSLKKRDEETKYSLKKLDEDRLENPHLALISDHLWWLALSVKLGLIMMALMVIIAAGG